MILRILPLALMLLIPRLAAAQQSSFDLAREIAEYEDTLKKIRDQRWIWIPVPDAGAFISPEAEAGLFSHMILLGMMHPDSVAATHRRYRERTRIVQAEIEATLADLREQERNLGQGAAPPTPVLPDRAQGAVGGTWAVACWMGDTPLNEGGSFTLRLAGDGSVSGSYTGPSGTFRVGGTIDDAGNIQGAGSHPDGSFSYFARIQVSGSTPRLMSGNVLFVPSSPEVSCAGGSLTPG